MALASYTGTFGKPELTHLLKRSLFGVKRTDLAAFSGKSLGQVVDALLLSEPQPSPPVNSYNDTSYTDPVVPAGQTWVNAAYDGNVNGRRNTSYKAWWLSLMLNQSPTLREKMVLFWSNHFSTEADTINEARYQYKTNVLYRTFAFGNFKDLVKQVTLDPSMLKYLNGYLNTKTAPDENYGRELQELFTVGKGPNSKYTEADVKAAARVLTGYKIDAANITSIFDSTRHDTNDKVFSSFYGSTIIKGKTGTAGATELDELISMIFSQAETARYLCRRLYRFFVYYLITPDIETNVITPMADLLVASNFDVKPVLKALFTSEHFFQTQNRGCQIKSPIDLCVGMMREFEVMFPDASDYVNAYYMHDYVRTQAATIQQDLHDPPNVSGWPAYYQEPQFYELWVNTDTLTKRNAFTDRFIGTGYTRNSKKILIDPIAYTDKLPNPADPNVLIADVLAQLYAIDVSANLKTFLKSILLSNQTTDFYWTDAWTLYKSNPANTTNKGIVTTRLQAMYKYIMNLAEYQLS